MKELNADNILVIDEDPAIVKRNEAIFNDDADIAELPTGVSLVSAGVFLCGAHAACGATKALKPTCVICAAPELPPPPPQLTHGVSQRVVVPVRDTPDTDIALYFSAVADLIRDVVERGGRVLTHCVAGVSRSVALCIAYLLKHQKMTLREAYYHLKKARPQIRPNTGFFKQLIKYEEKLFGSASVKMVYCEVIDKDIPDVYESDYAEMTRYHQRYGPIRP